MARNPKDTRNYEPGRLSRRGLLLGGTTLAAARLVGNARAQSGTSPASADKGLPLPDASFKGKVEETYKTSTSDFPRPVTPPKGAPNVLYIVIDDVGFGHPVQLVEAVATVDRHGDVEPELLQIGGEDQSDGAGVFNHKCVHMTSVS